MVTNDNQKLQKVATIFSCKFCDYNTERKSSYDKHLNTEKHNGNSKITKVATVFSCKFCDYNTERKSSYDKHLDTEKHNDNKKVAKVANNFICKCGNNYKYSSGYSRHLKICTYILNNEPINDAEKELSDKDLIMLLIKENSEIKNMMLKVIETGTHNTTNMNTNNNNNNNSNNKSFNLQFFLNETCKDAMNIMDFVDSITLQLSDLENVGRVGYVEGISKIITKKLKELDISQRPVHCTDKKRETMYVKDNNIWEKEDSDYKKLRKMIRKVADKNIGMFKKFKEAHPDCEKAISKYSDQYNKIIIESLGGSGDNEIENDDKIIKNITKIVTIDKDK
jgi:hypothetical protein